MVDDYDLGAIDHAKPTLITTAWARNHFEEWCRKPWINHYTTVLASSIIACR
jgi:hypothetical protein